MEEQPFYRLMLEVIRWQNLASRRKDIWLALIHKIVNRLGGRSHRTQYWYQ